MFGEPLAARRVDGPDDEIPLTDDVRDDVPLSPDRREDSCTMRIPTSETGTSVA